MPYFFMLGWVFWGWPVTSDGSGTRNLDFGSAVEKYGLNKVFLHFLTYFLKIFQNGAPKGAVKL